MFDSNLKTEGGPATRTLPNTQVASGDDIPTHPRIAHLATSAAGTACIRSEASPPALKLVAARRVKVIATGAGWPRPDVPYLRLRGRWLEHAGFVIGRHVRIEVSERRLTIEPAD